MIEVELIKNAVKLFIEKDIEVLQLKVYEPAVSHRIAFYIEKLINKNRKYAEFKVLSLNIDCEYNKIFDLEKRDENGKAMRPDILIHIRKERSNNLIAIEIKKSRKSKWDEKKLKTLTRRNGRYRYKLGAFVYFPNNKPKYKWFVNGEEENIQNN